MTAAAASVFVFIRPPVVFAIGWASWKRNLHEAGDHALRRLVWKDGASRLRLPRFRHAVAFPYSLNTIAPLPEVPPTAWSVRAADAANGVHFTAISLVTSGCCTQRNTLMSPLPPVRYRTSGDTSFAVDATRPSRRKRSKSMPGWNWCADVRAEPSGARATE